ncbi:MAG: hypothetical protein J6R08_08180 [Opitutales bacterium]|nr:hypothetical protein [Opitutales bacterium]
MASRPTSLRQKKPANALVCRLSKMAGEVGLYSLALGARLAPLGSFCMAKSYRLGLTRCVPLVVEPTSWLLVPPL